MLKLILKLKNSETNKSKNFGLIKYKIIKTINNKKIKKIFKNVKIIKLTTKCFLKIWSKIS